MSGQIKVNQVQLGDSTTASQNFVLQTNIDGTAKLARGNVGATTQDVFTVDASGNISSTQNVSGAAATTTNHLVNLGQFASSKAVNGYQRLPSGLLIQWGVTANIAISGSLVITYPTPFSTAVYSFTSTLISGSAIAGSYILGTSLSGLTSTTVYQNNSPGAASYYWMAIGV